MWRTIVLALAVVASWLCSLPAGAQTINHFAGGGAMLGDGGPASAAGLSIPLGVATDGAGNVFIADNTNSRIRRVDAGTGIITTIAGTGTFGYSGDGGPGANALISGPISVATDAAGNVYFTDRTNCRIRRISAATGVITTVAGNGLFGYTGDGGPATSARLGLPEGVAVAPDGDIYIADSSNFVVRRVDAVTGIITTIGGIKLVDPRRVAVDANENVYVMDRSSSSRIYRYSASSSSWTLSPVAGGGPGTGESGPPNMANFGVAVDVAVDNQGRLLIAGQRRVWRADLAANQISVVAGTGASGNSGDGGDPLLATFTQLGGVGAGPDGSIYISDAAPGANRVRVIGPPPPPPPPMIINHFAGGGAMLGDGGPASAAGLNGPQGVAVDAAGNVFIADAANLRVRRVDAVTGVITTYAGNGNAGFWGDGGPAINAQFAAPLCVALGVGGNLLIADSTNSRVRAVNSMSGFITTIAGNGLIGYTGDGGPALSARLAFPEGVAVAPDGDIYIADNGNTVLRRVDGVNSIITTIGGIAFADPRRVAVDAHENIYVLDVLSSSRVYRYNTATATWSIVAGGGAGTGESGSPTMANLGVAVDVAVDHQGRLLIAGARRVWRVDLAANQISVVAGTGASGNSGDGGDALLATFTSLGGVGAGPDGSIYISDAGAGANRVRVISPPGPVDVIITAATPQSVLDSLVIVTGNLIVSGDVNIASLSLPNLVQVNGDIIIAGNAALTTVGAPTLKQVDGSIEIDGNPMLGVVDFGALGGVGGDVTVANNDEPQIDFGALGGVGGDVTVANNDEPQIDFGALGGVGGDLTITDNNNPQFTLPALTDVGGDFTYGGNAVPTVLVLPSLTTLGGSFIVQGNGALVTLSAPLLVEVPGSVGIDGNPGLGVVDFSGLGIVGEDVIVNWYSEAQVDFSGLGIIGEDVIVNWYAGAQVDFSGLGIVGEDVIVNWYSGAQVDFSGLGIVGEDVIVTNDNDPQAALGLGTTPLTFPALTSVGGDLTVFTVGQAVHDFADAVVMGNTSISGFGLLEVLARSAAGSTAVAMDNGVSLQALSLPIGALGKPTGFALSLLDAAMLPPETGLDPEGSPLLMDPIAGYRYSFNVANLAQPALVRVTVDVAALDEPTRQALLASLADDHVVLAVRDDAPGSPLRALARCEPDPLPAGSGACFELRLLDAQNLPLPPGPPGTVEGLAYVEVRSWVDQFSSYYLALAPPPAACPGDTNGDGLVNGADLSVLLAQFGLAVTPGTGADFNGDGLVNGADLSVLLARFGLGCP